MWPMARTTDTAEPRRVRILVADDHAVVRRGLRQLLEEQPGWEVCGEAADGRQAIEMALALAPHVVVLDLAMPALDGLEATRQIRTALPATEVLILTMHYSEQLIWEALAAGAQGYLLKSDAAHCITAAVAALVNHKPFFAGPVSERIMDVFLRGGAGDRNGAADPLSRREREVVQLVVEGKTTRQIAVLLGISVKTVQSHRGMILRKLGARSVVDVVRYALRNQLTS
jgi:DNA-binding NarL/FixJ family response regulator